MRRIPSAADFEDAVVRGEAADLRLLAEDIRTIQELLGHADVKTTMIYTHVLQRVGGRGIRSPLDAIGGSPNETDRNEGPR